MYYTFIKNDYKPSKAYQIHNHIFNQNFQILTNQYWVIMNDKLTPTQEYKASTRSQLANTWQFAGTSRSPQALFIYKSIKPPFEALKCLNYTQL